MSSLSIPDAPWRGRLGGVITRSDYLHDALKAMRKVIGEHTRVMLTAESDHLLIQAWTGPYMVTIRQPEVQTEMCFSCAVPGRLLRELCALADGDIFTMELKQDADNLQSLWVRDRSGSFRLFAYETTSHDANDADVDSLKCSERRKVLSPRFESSDEKKTAGLIADLIRLDDERRQPMKLESNGSTIYTAERFTLTVAN